MNASSLAQFSATCSKQDKRELLARIRNLTALNCTIDLASAMAQAGTHQAPVVHGGSRRRAFAASPPKKAAAGTCPMSEFLAQTQIVYKACNMSAAVCSASCAAVYPNFFSLCASTIKRSFAARPAQTPYFASWPLRALSMPRVNPGSLYRCDKRN